MKNPSWNKKVFPTLLAFFEKTPLLLSLCDRDCIEWQATRGKRKTNHLKAEQMTAGKKKKKIKKKW